jgi:phage terminase large subunit
VQQRDGYLCFIDYYSSHGDNIADYVIALQNRGYMYGTDYLPHDAVDNIVHKNLVGIGDRTMTIPALMTAAGRKTIVGPKLLKHESLNAARTRFPLCKFDAVKCADGLTGLRHYQWNHKESDAKKRVPLHDFASHPADAFVTALVSIRSEQHSPIAYKPSPRAVAEI